MSWRLQRAAEIVAALTAIAITCASSAQGKPATVDERTYRAAVVRGRAAFDAAKFDEAAAAYAEAVAANPASASALYNQGVAQYRGGEFEKAAATFAQSAQLADAHLAASSMFNEGNSLYSQALGQLGSQEGSAAPQNPSTTPTESGGQPDLGHAIEQVKKALTHFKDASSADPTDVDARVNAETSHRLLKQLEEIQKQQQQQQQQQNQDQQKQDQSQEQKDQQQQDQQQGQQGQRPDEASEKDPGKSEGAEPKPQDQAGKESQESAQDKEEGKEQGKDEGSKQQQEQQAKQGQRPASGAHEQVGEGAKEEPSGTANGEVVEGAPLTKDQAEKLLQAVRDRAKARLDAKEAAQRTKQAPAAKDW